MVSSTFKYMNVCITGSTGFVGQNLIPYLKDKGLGVKTLNRLDLSMISHEMFDHCEVIIHLAGKAHDLKKTADPKAYYDINFELTKQLFDAFLKSDTKKFIFISSVKAAADSVDDVLTENVVPDPKTDYGKSKLLAEQYVQSQTLPEGKSFYILRPCMIHGPGNKGNLNLLYQFVKKGIPYPLAAFQNKRSFLSVENLCFVINQLLEKEIPSGIYNVADDEALPTSDVVKILAESLHKKPALWAIPKSVIIGLAKIGNLLQLPLNSERLHKLTENYEVSNGKIKKALQIQLPLTTKEGLRKTASSFGA